MLLCFFVISDRQLEGENDWTLLLSPFFFQFASLRHSMAIITILLSVVVAVTRAALPLLLRLLLFGRHIVLLLLHLIVIRF